MTCPICSVVGLTAGFAASKVDTEILKLAEMEVNVSPALMVYVDIL